MLYLQQHNKEYIVFCPWFQSQRFKNFLDSLCDKSIFCYTNEMTHSGTPANVKTHVGHQQKQAHHQKVMTLSLFTSRQKRDAGDLVQQLNQIYLYNKTPIKILDIELQQNFLVSGHINVLEGDEPRFHNEKAWKFSRPPGTPNTHTPQIVCPMHL